MKLHKFLLVIILPLLTFVSLMTFVPHAYAFDSDGTIDVDSMSYDTGTLTVHLKNFSVALDPADSCDIGSQLLFSVDSSRDFMSTGADEVYNPDSCSFDVDTNTASLIFHNFPDRQGYFAFSAISTYITNDSQNQWDTYITQPNGFFFSTN